MDLLLNRKKCALLAEKGITAYQIIAGEGGLDGERVDSFFSVRTLLVNIPPGGRRDPKAAQQYPQRIRILVREARRMGVRRLLFISSIGVFGDVPSIVTEMTALNPKTASGRALAEAEHWLNRQKGLDLTVLRFAGLVGGQRKAGHFLAGKKNLSGAKSPVNLIHLDDCIQIIFQILRQEKWGCVLNAAADQHPTRQQFYTYQAQKEGLEPPSFAKNGDGIKPGKIISNTYLKAVLGYDFIYPDPMGF